MTKSIADERGSTRGTAPRTEDEIEEAIADFLEVGLYNEALGLMMATYGERIARFLMRRVGDRPTAEDLTQETFVRAMKGLPRFRGECRTLTWLTTIAHNVLYTDANRASRRRDQRARYEDLVKVQTPRVNGQRVAHGGGRPDGAVRRKEIAEAIASCFSRMNEVVYRLALLVWVEGHTFVEAADITGMKEDAVRKRLVRARPILQRCLELRGVVLAPEG